MKELGGSLFIHNGLQYDYCLKEALESLLELCDEVIVLDAESTDGTLEFLHEMSKHYNHLKVYDHGKWECATDWNRLRILANEAKELLNTEWHFMLQADEVIHENSFDTIRSIINIDKEHNTFWGYRINLYQNFNHYIKFDSKVRPCGDKIVRLGKKEINAIGDAESLNPENHSDAFASQIIIFHYGLLRKPDILLDKYIDMQAWFGFGQDLRFKEMKEKYGRFKPEELIEGLELEELKWTHPKFAQVWVEERRHYYE